MNKKYLKSIVYVGICTSQLLNAAPSNDELLVLQSATATQMNTLGSIVEGSLIFNTDDKTMYEHNSTQWQRVRSDGSETKILAGNCTEITGSGTTADPYIVKNNPPAKTQATAGMTCKQILDIGCPVTSGMYWINPDGGSTANAFEVYCDMTTNGGGWTQIAYNSDLAHINRWSDGDQRRWLPSNLTLTLSDIQINNIRANSTEGKQIYRGTCDGVIHYGYKSSNSSNTFNYNYAFGFRYHTGFETAMGQSTYPNTNITLIQDGCYTNGSASADTVFEIHDIRVPIININSRDSGNASEQFGSPLTKNPAWLR